MDNYIWECIIEADEDKEMGKKRNQTKGKVGAMKRTAYIEVRTQHAVGGSNGGFAGPNSYVAVQVVPDGEERLKVLNRQAAANRGIKIIHCGEGYAEHRGPRSMFGRAMAEAERIAAEINGS